MNLLARIAKLLEEHNISRHQLAIQSGIPYSTIISLWAKGYENIKLSTLLSLANYFHVTLDYLVGYNVNPLILKDDEAQLIKNYEQAPAKIKRAVDVLLKPEE